MFHVYTCTDVQIIDIWATYKNGHIISPNFYPHLSELPLQHTIISMLILLFVHINDIGDTEPVKFIITFLKQWILHLLINRLLLLIFGMGSQLIWFYRERLVGGALYWKMCSVVYVLDLFSCTYMYEVITVKKIIYDQLTGDKIFAGAQL